MIIVYRPTYRRSECAKNGMEKDCFRFAVDVLRYAWTMFTLLLLLFYSFTFGYAQLLHHPKWNSRVKCTGSETLVSHLKEKEEYTAYELNTSNFFNNTQNTNHIFPPIDDSQLQHGEKKIVHAKYAKTFSCSLSLLEYYGKFVCVCA